MEVNEFVVSILKKPFFKQEDLAAILDVDQSTISSWKNGTRSINSDNFIKLCNILGYLRTDWIDGNTKSRIHLCYSAIKLNKKDIFVVSNLNQIATTLSLLDDINYEEIKFRGNK